MFPDPPANSRYGGMTVNERLFGAGTLTLFDEAVARRDRPALIGLLTAVELTRDEAEEAIDAIFSNPAKYGFKE